MSDRKHQVPRLDVELVRGCDQSCGHCYNVWNASGDQPQAGYPTGRLTTEVHRALVMKAIAQSGARLVTFTGGEPLLHPDCLAFITDARSLGCAIQLVTNGSHVSDPVARELSKAGVQSVQLTILSADRERHDRAKGAVCFDDTLRAAVNLRRHGVSVQVCFVATSETASDFEGVLELCYALGVRSLAYNRMAPNGGSARLYQQLLPSVEQVVDNLTAAQKFGPRYQLRIATGMPIPPCLIDHARFPWVQFGSCSVGGPTPNVTLDPLGNLRSCNLSGHLLGNLRSRDWDQIYPGSYVRDFHRRVPEPCRRCEHRERCQGGCKESAFAVFGDLAHAEPFLHRAWTGGSSRAQRLLVVG